MIHTGESSINEVIEQLHTTHILVIEQESPSLELTVTFSENTWAALLLWDSKQHLRWQYLYTQNDNQIKINIGESSSLSSLSTVNGSIPAGEWKFEIFCMSHQATPTLKLASKQSDGNPDLTKDTVNWAQGSDITGFILAHYDRKKVIKKGFNWYKGDFHTHTTESDGKMTVEKNVLQAKKIGLDFFVATDHNIIPTKWLTDNEILVIPGIEITSSKGHFNGLGVNNWIDWRPTCKDGGMESDEGMNRILKDVKNGAGLRSINHPKLEPWHWSFQHTDLLEIDLIEIWNDPTFSDNLKATEETLKIWDTLLNDGYRIYGIAGSDSHLLPEESYQDNGPPSIIGDPTTYVYAAELSTDAILTAVSEGNVYVSRGPVIQITAMSDDKLVHIGSETTASTIEFELTFENELTDLVVEWIVNGTIDNTNYLTNTNILKQKFDLHDKAFSWIRFNVRKTDGELVAFSNPVFKGTKVPIIQTWGNLLQKAGF